MLRGVQRKPASAGFFSSGVQLGFSAIQCWNLALLRITIQSDRHVGKTTQSSVAFVPQVVLHLTQQRLQLPAADAQRAALVNRRVELERQGLCYLCADQRARGGHSDSAQAEIVRLARQAEQLAAARAALDQPAAGAKQ